MERKSIQVGPRLPPAIYDWLDEMVQNGEYPNISQAVIGVLRDARFEDERKKFLSDYPTFEDLEKRLTIFKDEIRKDLKNGIREPDTNK